MGDRDMIGWSRNTEIRFVETVSILLDATLTVNETLHAVARMRNLGGARRVAMIAANAYASGQPISDTLRTRLRRLDPIHQSAWHAFDNLGTTDPMARALDLMRSWHGLRSRISTALIYPACILALTTVGVALLVFGVLPSVSVSLDSFGVATGPFVARVDAAARLYLVSTLVLAFLGVVVVVVRRSDLPLLGGLRTATEYFVSTLPIVRRLTLLRSFFYLASAASAVCQGGGTAEEGLSLGVDAIANGVVQIRCRRALDHVRSGIPVAESFDAVAGCRDIAGRWFDLLDQGSEPSAVFAGFSRYLQSNLELVASRISAAVEPATVGVTGLVVVILVVNMILPLIDMYGGLIP